MKTRFMIWIQQVMLYSCVDQSIMLNVAYFYYNHVLHFYVLLPLDFEVGLKINCILFILLFVVFNDLGVFQSLSYLFILLI